MCYVRYVLLSIFSLLFPSLSFFLSLSFIFSLSLSSFLSHTYHIIFLVSLFCVPLLHCIYIFPSLFFVRLFVYPPCLITCCLYYLHRRYRTSCSSSSRSPIPALRTYGRSSSRRYSSTAVVHTTRTATTIVVVGLQTTRVATTELSY